MRAAVLLLAIGLPVLADRIYLSDDRVLDGTAVLEGDTYVIRTKVGTVRVPKDQVVRIQKTDEAPPRPGGEKKEEGTSFESKQAAFSFRVRRAGWTTAESPPVPLVAAAAYNDAHQAEIDVVPLADREPRSQLSEDAAKSLQPTVEAIVSASCRSHEGIEMSSLSLPGGAAFQYRAEGKRRGCEIDVVHRAVAIKAGGKVFLLFYQAPFGCPVEVETAFEDVLSSFQAKEPNASAPDRYTCAQLEFSLSPPAGWSLEGKTEPDGRAATVSLRAPDGSREARLEVRSTAVEQDLEWSMHELSDSLSKELAGFSPGEAKVVTLHGKVCHLRSFTFHAGDRDRFGAACVLRDGSRVFSFDARANDAAEAGVALDRAVEGLEVFSAKAAVDSPKEDMRAFEMLGEADKELRRSEFERAKKLYSNLVTLRPRFAYAQLMLSLAASQAEDRKTSLSAAEAAWKLMPKRREFVDMLAIARAKRGVDAAKEQDFAKAGDFLADAASLGSTSEDFPPALHDGIDAIVHAADKDNRAQAITALKKLRGRARDDVAVTEALAALCYDASDEALHAGDYAAAEQAAKEGLTYMPGNDDLTKQLKKIKEAKEEDRSK